MRVLFLIIAVYLLMSNAIVRAETGKSGFDYEAWGSAQSYPLGGLLYARAGYGQLLWQNEDQEAETPWQFGYIRPYAELNIAGVLNRGAVGLEIFPVSIFGITAGSGYSHRNATYFQDFDCGTDVMCNEGLQYSFLQARAIGAYKDFLLVVTGKYEAFRANKSDLPFYEEMSYLVGNPGKDDLKTLQALAGYKLSDLWTVGTLGIFQNFIHSESNNSQVFAFARYKEGFWTGDLGLGHYKSTHQDGRPAVFLSVTYTGIKSIGL